MNNTIARQYLIWYGDDDDAAMRAFVTDLMQDDPAHHKRGYTRENAIIAVAEAFDVPRETVERVMA